MYEQRTYSTREVCRRCAVHTAIPHRPAEKSAWGGASTASMQLTASLFFSVASSIFSLLDGQGSVASATLGIVANTTECRCRLSR